MSGAVESGSPGTQPAVLILAGGMGRRCGGVDKGWIEINGEALVTRRMRQLSGSPWPIAISANRSLDRYRSLGVPVFVDRDPGFAGPLAAISAALHGAFGDPLISVPVDIPDVPFRVLQRLLDASLAGTRATYARDAGGVQPLVAVWPRTALETVETALRNGQRAVRAVQSRLGALAVEFPEIRLGNLNCAADIEARRHAEHEPVEC